MQAYVGWTEMANAFSLEFLKDLLPKRPASPVVFLVFFARPPFAFAEALAPRTTATPALPSQLLGVKNANCGIGILGLRSTLKVRTPSSKSSF